MKILIINGANLNMLGKREPNIYGFTSFEEYLNSIRKRYKGHQIDYFQSNIEGEIVNRIQHADDENYTAIILNAGGYTHTSVSIADAIKAISTPVTEVHISNILNRESYRQHSITGAACKGIISGFGLRSYEIAIAELML